MCACAKKPAAHTHARTHARTRTHIQHAQTYTYTANTHIHTAYTHHTHAHAHDHTRKRTDTNTHTRTQTHTHAHTPHVKTKAATNRQKHTHAHTTATLANTHNGSAIDTLTGKNTHARAHTPPIRIYFIPWVIMNSAFLYMLLNTLVLRWNFNVTLHKVQTCFSSFLIKAECHQGNLTTSCSGHFWPFFCFCTVPTLESTAPS